MEASTLKHVTADGLRGPTPLLRIQSDERLVALTRRGNQAAYEALVGRYQSRLLAFCRHMLGSREDAEDVLQEVFAAAFNAMIADERPLNVRPWLYRIARNRSLNHLRRVQAIGVDSMDVHLSENGASAADKVHRREEFRLLVEDVQGLPETQRTALLLREIDALSYDQIAEAMETTIPSVKSLLVRARVSLAESAEARHLTLRRGARRARRGRRGPAPHDRARRAATCASATAARRSASSCARPTARWPPSSRSGRCCCSRSSCSPTSAPRPARAAAPPAAGAGCDRRGRGRGQRAVGRRRRRWPPRPPPGWPPPRSSPPARSRSTTHAQRRPASRHAAVAAVATVPASPRVVASQPQPVAAPLAPRARRAAAKPEKAAEPEG